jgi:hypothetical protein
LGEKMKGIERVYKHGIYLVPPHGRLLALRKKTAILKSRRYKIEGKSFVILSGLRAFGFVIFGKPKRIRTADVLRGYKRKQHRVSPSEIRRWRWKRYRWLWIYPVRKVKKKLGIWLNPKRGIQTFARNVRIRWVKK